MCSMPSRSSPFIIRLTAIAAQQQAEHFGERLDAALSHEADYLVSGHENEPGYQHIERKRQQHDVSGDTGC